MSKARKEQVREKVVRSVETPAAKELEEYVRSLSYVTPSMLAERFKVRLSLAKDLLSQLASQGLLRVVSGTNRLRIYAVVGGKAPTRIQATGSPGQQVEAAGEGAVVSKAKKSKKSGEKKKK
ncbi:MAG: 40S ribosomal protein S25 [Thaumarchaeota archaeon]|nr:40S ribosomal protein S25 [Candidatus Calditenuaceae archaeon]MDW8042499.1 eS25 family ribosomal protein [Nitrososphaerota archaeon]